jgi:S-DNA-T family DNA segregation ATPase FtsK/SpoIIIE
MHRFPREGRAYWISDLQIVETATKYARTQDDEDGDEPAPPGGGRPRLLKSVPCFPDGSQVPENRVPLWQALDRSGAKGATINDLLAANLPGINSRTAVSDPLQLWKARGWVVEVGTGPDRSKIFAVARHVKAA